MVAPKATVTLPGKLTALLLLARLTPIPPDSAAEVRVTVQFVVAAPVNELPAHESEVTDGNDAEDVDVLFNLIEVDFETDPCFAVSVTVCDEVTAETLATNPAVVAPDATVTDEGTLMALLLLDRFTANPEPVAAELNVTKQASDAAPVIEVLAQLRVERVAVLAPLPCSFTVLDKVVSELLIAFTVNLPVALVVSLGL